MSSSKPPDIEAPEPQDPLEQLIISMFANRPNMIGPDGAQEQGRMGSDGQWQSFDPSNPALMQAMRDGDWLGALQYMPNTIRQTEDPLITQGRTLGRQNDMTRGNIGADYLRLFQNPGKNPGYLPNLPAIPTRSELDVNRYRWARNSDD